MQIQSSLTRIASRRRSVCLAAALSCALLAPAFAADEVFPTRPVHVVVPFAAGNTLDNALRQVAEEYRKSTGQPMIIENKPGGAGLIAAQQVARATADGYTLLLVNTSMLTINPYTFKKKLPYDADKSFKYATGLLGSTLVLAANKTVPANNLQEFAQWSRTQKNPVSYASFTAGNSSHFAGVILNEKLGLNLVHVPFNGTPPAVQNLIGEQVQTAFLPLPAVKPHVDTGKVKVLGVSGPKRSELLPDVQTFAEQGVPEMTLYVWSGFAAPAGTPDAVFNKLSEDINKILRSQDIRTKWRDMDFTPLPMTPAEFTSYIRDESSRWRKVVEVSGFKIED
ncbi:Bug family tripartite tricarboxylate transporter substrate binding protein [Comamonas thiooxydans]|uniref:Bug family tripartite tricarboxylate transporter substrate binding protein n=1 Tax=Comamonas thiooxydans TaxID=363952 RepID=UPI00209C24DA|nr:tripartite tricarboxylate transporter substrate binding protein [Comamonas thiooxydans]